MSARAKEPDDLWVAVTDPTRRQLLDFLLAHGEATATTLAADLPISRQAVVKHLAILDRTGLVVGRRQGRELRFAIHPERLDVAARRMADVAAEWDARLTTIKRLAELSEAGGDDEYGS